MKSGTFMALHIKDAEATDAVRELARLRGITLTEAVKFACREALSRDRRRLPAAERLSEIHARVRAARPTGRKADKGFFDKEWGDT
jgi:antitoxin VapB